jgi:hypothetical protein
MTLVKQLEEES